jgi:hypothetical protein
MLSAIATITIFVMIADKVSEFIDNHKKGR